MPPKRCPECGRFLANDLVSSLADAPAPCPRCGEELRPDTIVGGDRARRTRPARPSPAPPPPAAAAASDATGDDASEPVEHDAPVSATAGDAAPAAGSIRPPDLDPAAVRTPDDDVLAGWDAGATAEEVASWRVDRRPFPTDTVAIVGAGLGVGLLAGLLADRHRGRWAVIGGLGGAVGAGVARRIWELRA